jgi:hypothetical protein
LLCLFWFCFGFVLFVLFWFCFARKAIVEDTTTSNKPHLTCIRTIWTHDIKTWSDTRWLYSVSSMLVIRCTKRYREYRRVNQELTMLRHRQPWAQNTVWGKRIDNAETRTTLGTKHRMRKKNWQCWDTDNLRHITQNEEKELTMLRHGQP